MPLAAVAAMLFGALAQSAVAQDCRGLECSDALPVESAGRGAVKSVVSAKALETQTVPGFYEYGLNDPTYRQRAVAYVAPPGTIDAAPPEIQAMPAAQVLTATDRKLDTVVIYDPGIVTITGASARADALRAKESRRPKQGTRKARAAQEPGFCGNGWFCIFDYDDYVGDRGMFQSTSVWQNLVNHGWDNRAESMQNRRSGATLLAYGTGGGGGQRYCAQANSSDSDFSNNASISNNASSLYNSTAANYHSGWDCFNPY